jgi:hypothetical protein
MGGGCAMKVYDLTRPVIRDELDEGLEKAKRWRNMWFLKDGKHYMGDLVYDSEKEAVKIGFTSQSYTNPPHYFLSPADHEKIGVQQRTYRNADISHFIPMPIGGE